MESPGKHAGKRRAEAPPDSPGDRPASGARRRASLLVHAIGVTLAVVAWGYLVYAAIDFGATARGGESRAWWFLGIASLGAVACLFVGMLLLARVLRLLGVTKPPGPPPPPRPVGGKRAAR